MNPIFSNRFFFAAFLCAALLLVLPPRAAADLLPVSALQGKKALLVTGAPDPEHPSDDALVKAHLEALGFLVTETLDTDPAPAAGQDLVVISSTANAHLLRRAYQNSPVPVFTWNAADYPNLGLTGPVRHRDFEVIEPVQFYAQSFSVLYGYCISATNPIARAVGLSAQEFGTLYLQPMTAGWGDPGPAAGVVATFDGDPHKAALFTYEKDAALWNARPAPARRVGFYLGDDNFHLLTYVAGPAANDPDQRAWYVGRALFDAAIRWAVSPPPPAPKFDPAALHAALAQAAAGKKILFVERKDGGEGREADEHNVAYLRQLGFTITIADQTDPQSIAAGQDAVIISATCSKYKLTNKYQRARIPVMCYEGLYSDVLWLSGRNRYTDYGEHGEEKESDDPPENYLDLVGAWSPLAAGLPDGPVEFTKSLGTLKWAVPSRGATVIATLPNAPRQCAIFGYEKGATMANDHLAPARRLLFPLDNPSFDDLTPAGLALYDAALLWVISPPTE